MIFPMLSSQLTSMQSLANFFLYAFFGKNLGKKVGFQILQEYELDIQSCYQLLLLLAF